MTDLPWWVLMVACVTISGGMLSFGVLGYLVAHALSAAGCR